MEIVTLQDISVLKPAPRRTRHGPEPSEVASGKPGDVARFSREVTVRDVCVCVLGPTMGRGLLRAGAVRLTYSMIKIQRCGGL